MSKSDSVDVVIPTYNETTRLKRALDSVLRQDGNIKNIYIIDDGSNLQVRLFLEENISKMNRVRLILVEHTGNPAIIRNIGIKQCDSKWVAFLDSDDEWIDGKLETQLDFASQKNLDFVATDALINEEGQETRNYLGAMKKSHITTKDLINGNLVINSSAIVKLEKLKQIEGYASENHVRGIEDYATWLRLSTNCKIGIMSQPLVGYSFSGNSFSRNLPPVLTDIALLDFYFWMKIHNVKKSRFVLLLKIIRRMI